MPNLHRFLSRRRLLGFLAGLALIFGLLMLHPYPRQSLFGPTIRGKPWCEWEWEFRRLVHWRDTQKTLTLRIQQWAGIEPKEPHRLLSFEGSDMFELMLALTEDADPKVRLVARHCILIDRSVRDRAALPILRAALNDEDEWTRKNAAAAIWRIERDHNVIPIVRAVVDHGTHKYRASFFYTLISMHRDAPDPELLALIDSYRDDADPSVRMNVLAAVDAKEGVARRVLGRSDPEPDVRAYAARSLRDLGHDAIDSVPQLDRGLEDQDKEVRRAARNAIARIDLPRYLHLKAAKKIE